MSDYYRRNLPHYQPTGGEFFVTFRLVNSLPNAAIASLRQEYKVQLKNIKDAKQSSKSKLTKLYFGKFDKLLDENKDGNLWLKSDNIAAIIAQKLHNFDSKKYELICYCIMPNHVHLLFRLLTRDESRATYPVTEILRLIKGATARKANKILGRSGVFWQHESYDHLVRNDKERERIIRYILKNPVQSGFVKSWEKWKWSFCKEEYFPIR